MVKLKRNKCGVKKKRKEQRHPMDLLSCDSFHTFAIIGISRSKKQKVRCDVASLLMSLTFSVPGDETELGKKKSNVFCL